MIFNTRSFVWRYLLRAYQLKSILCVGLDPTPAHVPPSFGMGIEGIERYLRFVIKEASTRVPVVKPQYAYYAALDAEFGLGQGIALMCRLIKYAHSLGLLVILDAKRDDIGDTMFQYGVEVFDVYDVDACTVVRYLGSTMLTWSPWLNLGKMAISMIRTSNKEAEEFQDLRLESGLLVYEDRAVVTAEWNKKVLTSSNGAGAIGGVVGATWPEQAPRCRELAGDDVFFLIPGYGAQGGDAEGSVAGLVNSLGMIMGTVNSSRGITLDSWFDRKASKEGRPREGDASVLVIAAIDATNEALNAALFIKYGTDIYDFELFGIIERKGSK